MAFLRTLLWIVITIVVVVFSLRNWAPVTLNLFGDRQADVKLPVLLLIAFLLGFLPIYAWYRMTIWRHRRAIALARTTPVEPLVMVPTQAAPPVPLRPTIATPSGQAGFGPVSVD